MLIPPVSDPCRHQEGQRRSVSYHHGKPQRSYNFVHHRKPSYLLCIGLLPNLVQGICQRVRDVGFLLSCLELSLKSRTAFQNKSSVIGSSSASAVGCFATHSMALNIIEARKGSPAPISTSYIPERAFKALFLKVKASNVQSSLGSSAHQRASGHWIVQIDSIFPLP